MVCTDTYPTVQHRLLQNDIVYASNVGAWSVPT